MQRQRAKGPKIALILIIAGIISFLFLLAPVLQPFYIAALIAYLSNPLVDYLQRLKVPRIVAVILVFLLILSLLTLLGLVLIPLIIQQINLLFGKIPLIVSWVQLTLIPWINSKLGNVIQFNMQNFNTAVVEGIKSHQDIIGKILATVTTSGMTIATFAFELLLIPVVTFYLLRDWHLLLDNCRDLLPRSVEPTVVMLAARYNDVLRAFLRGQLMVMVLLGIIYTIGLWLVGLQFAILIGVLAGLLSIVPYLGFSVGFVVALLAGYYQFGSINALLYISLVFIIGQCLESMVLTPLLVGDSIGLHPVAVIFAVLAGGHFFGLIGALIALPVAAAIMVLLRYGLRKYYRSAMYS